MLRNEMLVSIVCNGFATVLCGKPVASGNLGGAMGVPELREGGWRLCCQRGE